MSEKNKSITMFNVTLSIIHIIGNEIILWSDQWFHKIEITVSCVLKHKSNVELCTVV